MVPPLPAGAAPPLPTSPPPPSPTPTSSQPPLPTSPPPRPAISSSISTRSHLLKAIQEGKTLKKTITNDGSGLHSSPERGDVRGERVSMGKSDVVNGKENGGVKTSERPSGNDLMKAILEAKPLRKASTGASAGQEAGLGAGLGAGQGAEPGAGLDAGLGAGQDAGLGAGPGNNLFEALRGEGKQSEGKERENTDWGSKTGDSEAKPVTKTTKEASGDSPSGLRSHNKVVEALKERKGRKSLGEIGKGEEAKKENGLRAAQTNDGVKKTIQSKEKVEKSQGLCVVQGLLYPPSSFQDMDGNPAKVRHS